MNRRWIWAAGIVVAGVLSTAATPVAKQPKSLKFTKRQLMVAPNQNCTVADLDKDGHLDII